MRLIDLISLEMVKLHLGSTSKNEVLKELVALLKLDETAADTLYNTLRRRQLLGSTGIGRGVAVVYTRFHSIRECRVGFGRSRDGIDFEAIDGKPAHYFFLIVAPPLEETNQFLPVLGRIAKLAREPDFLDRLGRLECPEDFLRLLEERPT